MGGCGKGGGRAVMRSAMTLIHNHTSIERTVEEVPGGVRTVTTTTDPALVDTLREHVREMALEIELGGRVRQWDPLFAEIFDHYEEISLSIMDVEGGVEVVETSKNDEVVKLIRAHAAKVDEFVARGPAAAHEATPLPEDYNRPGDPLAW